MRNYARLWIEAYGPAQLWAVFRQFPARWSMQPRRTVVAWHLSLVGFYV
jgi:hypothetical protein